MSNPPPAAKKSEKMQKSDQKLQQQTSMNKNADGVVEPCPLAKKEKIYTYLGLRLRVRQYPIGGRKLALDVPMYLESGGGGYRDKAFNDLTDSAFKLAETIDKPLSAHKLYNLGADSHGRTVFQCDLTTVYGFLRETGVDYYQRYGKSESQLNSLLGRSFALHIQRSGVFRNPTTGNFYCKDIQTGTPALIKTEKFAAKFSVYVDMKLNGKTGIYRIEKGTVDNAPVSPQVYDQEKYLAYGYRDEAWGTMPLSPNVQQFHVLLTESGQSFILKEVYCDGDCIYPE